MNAFLQVVDRHLAGMPNTQQPREEILRRLIADLERLGGDKGNRSVRHTLASAHLLLGDVNSARGEQAQAHQEYERAYTLGKLAVQGSAPVSSMRGDLADMCIRLSASNLDRGDVKAAQKNLDEAEAILRE